MPLLARMVSVPLVVDIRAGAIDGLPALLVDQRISSGGRVAVVIGARTGEPLRERLTPMLPAASWFVVTDATIDAATALSAQIGSDGYDAVVGIGGGRVLDTTKYAAGRLGLPMVSVATNLAHDGLASPVAILEHAGARGSYGVPSPLAVVVDLDLVRAAPAQLIVGGIGDALSNLSALADWQLSHEQTGEVVDGLAVVMARTAGELMLHRDDGVGSEDFLQSLAEALVLSGLAMSVSGTSRPCSGACHEILHAIDRLYPDRRSGHGQQAGMGAAVATWLRGDLDLADLLVTRLRQHGLPVLAEELGLTRAELSAAVTFAPATRPGRYTILEHLDLSATAMAERIEEYSARYGGAR